MTDTKTEVAFPDAHTLEDLFDGVKPWEPEAYRVDPAVVMGKDWIGAIGKREPGITPMYVGPYCHIRGGKSLAVRPNEAILTLVRDNMIHLAHERMHFEIVPWDGGRALVILSYGRIIGTRWLAVIDWPATV